MYDKQSLDTGEHGKKNDQLSEIGASQSQRIVWSQSSLTMYDKLSQDTVLVKKKRG